MGGGDGPAGGDPRLSAIELTEGWEAACAPAGSPNGLDGLTWMPARVPGTAAAAVGDSDGRDFDAEDWWFRTHFVAPEPLIDGRAPRHVLELDGLATMAEVYLNGERVLESDSMWAAHAVDVTGTLRTDNELVIVCRALTPLLARRRRPGARWRTRVVANGNLRWVRTMVFGRSPGFAPGPATVGPWRPVRLATHRGSWIRSLRATPSVADGDGRLRIEVAVEGEPGRARAWLDGMGIEASLQPAAAGRIGAELVVPDVKRWWPHTHGAPHLYDLVVEVDEHTIRRRVGFRTLEWSADIRRDGLALAVNGVPVFARGAVWTPPELVTMAPEPATLAALLGLVRDAGMNMVRIPGMAAYESDAFHERCDELGILVWQDLMFANLDYPFADEAFRAAAEAEVRDQAARLAAHPSTVVICGNNEVEQQPAMMGLDPMLGRSDFFEATVPELLGEAGFDGAYVPSTPCGGALPFHANRGVTHYFGVSGYFQPPHEARRAGVRFASECLAFANVPDEVSFQVHDPRWKRGVPRDAGTGWDQGAGWDFDDVRDGYLAQLFGADPVQLRRVDPERYFELSRAVSGEVMADVIGEWRRRESPCRGALVLWLKDMVSGAGLGVIDHAGRPKLAYHHLRRAMAPLAVWLSDEGVNGADVHVANDGPDAVSVELHVALYRRGEILVGEATETLTLPPHGGQLLNIEVLLHRFVDAAWAYRFGPAGHDAIVATLHAGGEPVSQAFAFPAGRPLARRPATELGLEAALAAGTDGDGSRALALRTRALVYGVRIDAPGYVAADNGFSLAPGGESVVRLIPTGEPADDAVTVHAINLETPLRCKAS